MTRWTVWRIILSRFALDYLSAAEIRCRLDVPLQLPTLPVTAEKRHNLFLAFKEALHNVVKHSAANEVRVELKLEAAQLAIRVADNGRGFDAASTGGWSRGGGPHRARQRTGEHAAAAGGNRRRVRDSQRTRTRHDGDIHRALARNLDAPDNFVGNSYDNTKLFTT